MKNKLIIAHRGETRSAVENTLAAFEQAAKMGADMIELDVRQTADGVAVVHHNRLLKRKIIGRLMWVDIEKMNANGKKKVPKLEDVFKFAAGKIKIDIELKDTGREDEVARMALKYLGPEGFIVTSFNDSSIREVKNKFPEIKTGLLFSPRHGLISLKKRLERCGADYLLPHISLVRLGFLRRLRLLGKPFIIWSVKNRKTIAKLLKKDSVVGIIVDDLKNGLETKNDLT